jgi:hypothetical protein
MSDAKAKAEARRAKILAREGTRLLVAKGEKDSINEPVGGDGEDVAAPKVRERPLAARRNLVAAVGGAEPKSDESGKDEKDGTAEPATAAETATSAATTTTAPSSSGAASSSSATSSDKGPAMTLTSQRTREIEQEIARNTAKFDENVVKKDGNKEVEKSKEEEKAKVLKKIAMKAAKAPLQAHQVMRFIRVLVIVLLAAVTGYRSATTNMDEVVAYGRHRPAAGAEDAARPSTSAAASVGGMDSARQALSAVLGGPSATDVPHFSGAVNQAAQDASDIPGGRTWVQWAHSRLLRQLECSLTAVWLVWWVTSLFTSLVGRAFPKQSKESGLMAVVISLYNHGVDGIVEIVVGRLGELALHVFVTVGTAMLVTFLLGGAADGTVLDAAEPAAALAAVTAAVGEQAAALAAAVSGDVVEGAAAAVGDGAAAAAAAGMVEAVVEMAGDAAVEVAAAAAEVAAAAGV